MLEDLLKEKLALLAIKVLPVEIQPGWGWGLPVLENFVTFLKTAKAKEKKNQCFSLAASYVVNERIFWSIRPAKQGR